MCTCRCDFEFVLAVPHAVFAPGKSSAMLPHLRYWSLLTSRLCRPQASMPGHRPTRLQTRFQQYLYHRPCCEAFPQKTRIRCQLKLQIATLDAGHIRHGHSRLSAVAFRPTFCPRQPARPHCSRLILTDSELHRRRGRAVIMPAPRRQFGFRCCFPRPPLRPLREQRLQPLQQPPASAPPSPAS